ncbi:MAG: hypothetical protein ABL916_23995 [Burkholderiaceae bacterium]
MHEHQPHSKDGHAYSVRLPSGVQVSVIVEPPPGGSAWRAQQIGIERLVLELLKRVANT